MARVSTGQVVVVSSALVVWLVVFATACGGGGGEPLDESEWAAQVCTVQSRLDDDLEAEIFGSPAPGLHLQLQFIAEAHQRAAEDLAAISPPSSALAYHEALQKSEEELAQAAFASMTALSDWTSEEEFEASLDSYDAVSARSAEDVDAAWDSLPDSAQAALNGCMGR